MTGQVPVLLQSEPDAPKRSVNRPEVALWILGFVLLVASAALFYGYLQVLISQSTINSGQYTVTFETAFVDTSSAYTPGLVTAGILCIALAIFLRGLDANARRRATQSTAYTPIAATIPEEVLNDPAPPRTSAERETLAPTTPTDYSTFMRPSGRSADLHK